MADFKQKFFDITSLVQIEFNRNLEMYGDKIQCRRGCSKCCSQIFRITPLDGWIISEHIRTLPEDRKAELKQKARVYLNALPETYVTSFPQTDIDSVHALPCPALGAEGECTIYEARPVICRRFGMPIYDYKNPQKVHACELNFQDGDEITDAELIPNQTLIGRKWDELKDEFMESESQSGNDHTTIADAICDA